MVHEAEKRSIVDYFRYQYRRASKTRKGKILDEVCSRTGWTRKHAARLLRERKPRGRPKIPRFKRGRPGTYQDKEFIDALRLCWKSTRFMCSRHLKVAIPEWLPYVERKYGRFPDDIRSRLIQVSHSTIDRILKKYRGSRGKSFTRASGFRDEIPIQENIWNVAVPGFVEVDTAAHCGSSMAGEFLNSVLMVDIATTWTAPRIVYGRGSHAVLEEIKHIEQSLPFVIRGYDADNGGEVLNKQLLHYFTTERIQNNLPPVQVTRSRAYQKNDNAHVEQRNNSVARRWLGYERFDFQELLPLVQYYYVAIVDPLINHFFPSFKLKDKRRKRSRTQRIYGTPTTPYRRVLESPAVAEWKKERLIEYHQTLDPLELLDREREYSHKIFRALKDLRAGKSDSPNLKVPPLPPVLFPEHGNSVSETRISAEQYHNSRKQPHKFGDHEF